MQIAHILMGDFLYFLVYLSGKLLYIFTIVSVSDERRATEMSYSRCNSSYELHVVVATLLALISLIDKSSKVWMIVV
jgi:hypothetical protein